MSKRLRLILLVFIFSVAAREGNASVLVLSDKKSVYDLVPYAEILPMYDQKTSLYHIVTGNIDGAFRPLKVYKPDTSHLHWIQVSIRNASSKSNTWVFGLGDSNEEITIYMVDSTGIAGYKKSGTHVPMSMKEIKVGRGEFSSFNIEPGAVYTFYIRIANYSQFANQFLTFSFNSFKLYSQESFVMNFETAKMFNVFFYGAIFTMLFYNLLLSINLYSMSYFYYVLYVFLFFLFNLFTDGIITEWLLYNAKLQNHMLRILVAPIMFIAYLQFSRSYLRSKTITPKADKVILLIMLLVALTYLPMLFGYWWPGRNLLLVMIILGAFYIVGVSIVIYRKGFPAARYFIIANLLLLLATILYAFYLSGVIPHTPFTRLLEYTLQVASVFELCIFSLGLSYRIKEADKYMMRQNIEQELAKQALIEEKNEELELKVKQRTEELMSEKEKIALINEDLSRKVKERTKKLQKAYRDLLNLNYELDSFIYRAAHDVRGPITTIMGLCNLALMEKDPQKTRDYLQILDAYSKKTQSTLNRILSVNEIKNNHIKTSYFSLNDLKENVLTLLEANPHRNKVNINFTLTTDILVYSDQALVELLLVNMAENSIRFRINESRDKPFCHINFQKEENGLKIIISDNGHGIDDTIKDRIFDMFFRGSEYASGSGLGLYIAKIAAKKLHGDISLVHSVRGNTVFEIFLPNLKERKQFDVDPKNFKPEIDGIYTPKL